MNSFIGNVGINIIVSVDDYDNNDDDNDIDAQQLQQWPIPTTQTQPLHT